MRTVLAGFHLEGNGGSWNPGAGGDGWSGGGGGCGGDCGCGGSCGGGGGCDCKSGGGSCGGQPTGGCGDKPSGGCGGRPSDGGGSPGGGSGQLPLIPDYDGEIWAQSSYVWAAGRDFRTDGLPTEGYGDAYSDDRGSFDLREKEWTAKMGCPTEVMSDTGGNVFATPRLDEPGCTTDPFYIDNPCRSRCCAYHDKCYHAFGCTSASWVDPLVSVECFACNYVVANCIAACLFGFSAFRGFCPGDMMLCYTRKCGGHYYCADKCHDKLPRHGPGVTHPDPPGNLLRPNAGLRCKSGQSFDWNTCKCIDTGCGEYTK
jgi:hypothetical protein